MTYIVERNNRFYVVTYDGIEPTTGKERRKWTPAGHSRSDAEAILTAHSNTPSLPRATNNDITLGQYLTDTWLHRRKQQTRPTTANRYAWMINNNIIPALGHLPLRSIRTHHLASTGGRHHTGLAPKTVHEVHAIIRSALTETTRIGLTNTNPTLDARPPRPHRLTRTGPATWTSNQLADFLNNAHGQRLYPALHLAATTGMRRGELAGLRWGDWNPDLHHLSISRTRQVVGGRSTEFPTKTRTSRRCIDLDPTTETHLHTWRQRLDHDDIPTGTGDPIFVNTHGHALHAESLSQLFQRVIERSDLPRIRFHDLRHTHASLLIANGTPIKVVSERLGHAHPGFTMATYQHVLPGMGAIAATRFADLISNQPVDDTDPADDENPQLTESAVQQEPPERLPNR